MSPQLHCRFALPADYRAGDVLAFHRRDPQALAERVGAHTLEKGLVWAGRPACLTVSFEDGEAQASLCMDGPPAAAETSAAALQAMVRRMLGLDQDVVAFEARHRGHPQLGGLIACQPGLRVPAAATPFEALSWAITGQQISVGAALALRRRLIAATGLRHSGGLICYPTAAEVAALDEAALRAAGFSTAKARTLLDLAENVRQGALTLDAWAAAPDPERIRAHLLAQRGIGPWTADYTLLRGYGWLDGSLHGDAAVRRALHALRGGASVPGERETRDWLAPFSPWRALVGAHLWASLTIAA